MKAQQALCCLKILFNFCVTNNFPNLFELITFLLDCGNDIISSQLLSCFFGIELPKSVSNFILNPNLVKDLIVTPENCYLASNDIHISRQKYLAFRNATFFNSHFGLQPEHVVYDIRRVFNIQASNALEISRIVFKNKLEVVGYDLSLQRLLTLLLCLAELYSNDHVTPPDKLDIIFRMDGYKDEGKTNFKVAIFPENLGFLPHSDYNNFVCLLARIGENPSELALTLEGLKNEKQLLEANGFMKRTFAIFYNILIFGVMDNVQVNF